MRLLSRRVTASALLAALLATAGCGGGGEGTDTPGPEAGGVAPAPDLGFAITPSAYRDPFTGALDVAAQAPAVALLLAKGFAVADKRRGDLDSPAADLAAQFTSLLTTHVYAVGAAVTTAYATSPASPKTEAARAAVDANSKALSKLVEALAAETADEVGSGGRGNAKVVPPPVADDPKPAPTGDPAAPDKPAKGKKTDGKDAKKKPSASPTPTEPPFDLDDYNFAKAWREHVDVLGEYASAAKEENERDQRRARADLDAWRAQAGQYFRAISDGRLSSSVVRTDLGRYTKAITTAIDALAERDGEGYVALRTAADEMPETVARLAAGLASATDRDGSVYDEAAKLRTELVATMTGHGYLSAISFLVAAGNGESGLVSAGYRRVQVALDDNSKELAALVRQVSGPIKEAEFLQGWRIYLRQLENYAKGLQAGDVPTRTAAMAAVDTYLGTVTKFFRSLTGGEIEPAALDKRLRAEVAAMVGVVDALGVLFKTGD